MPAGDRTGPLGQGPGTGRASGFCYGFENPGYMTGPGKRIDRGFSSIRGGAHRYRGCGCGRGGGFGSGGGFARGGGFGSGRGLSPDYHPRSNMPGYPWTSSLSREGELGILKSQAEALKRSQKEIERRIGELGKEE